MTGIDVTKLLKGCQTTKDIPVIMMSNYHNSNSNNHKIIESGVRLYLKKTIQPELLLDEIRKIEGK